MKKNLEIIGLIYKSVDYLNLLCSQLNSESCKVPGWDISVRVIANDATEEVLEALISNGINYTIYNDPHPEDFYLNRVYRCWNFAAETSEKDNICFVNSDMVFSDSWLENLLKHHDGTKIPCSRLVESGKLRSGQYGIEKDFGKKPSEIQFKEFNEFAKSISEPVTKFGGLFMPCVFEKDLFLEYRGYPEGNVFMDNDAIVVGYPNDRPVFMSGDAFFFALLYNKHGIAHTTVFDSIVYHIQEGEKDETP